MTELDSYSKFHLLWKYGIVSGAFGGYHTMPARKNRITGLVEIRYWNSLFNYWSWYECNEKASKTFKEN